jgi:hypothetical protein
MCLFHKWGKWEEYSQQMIVYPGIFSSKENRGNPVEIVEMWQKRTCTKCGYTQRQEVAGV